MRLPLRANFLSPLAIPLIAVGLSSITLWLLESPLKYPFFIFEVALILSLYFAFSNKGSPKQLLINTRWLTPVIDRLLGAASLILLLLVIFNSYSILNQVLAIAVTFFMPGYVLLRFIRFRSLYTWVEWVVLSLVLSIPISSLISSFVLLLVSTGDRALGLSLIYLFISLSLFLRHRRLETDQEPSSHSIDLISLAPLVVVILFFFLE